MLDKSIGLSTGGANIDVSSEDYTRDDAFLVYVGSGGDIKVTTSEDSTITYSGFPSSAILPQLIKKVWSTGTDASDLVAMW